jgi:hypothetical protein
MNLHPIARSTVPQALVRRLSATRPDTVYFRTKLRCSNMAQSGMGCHLSGNRVTRDYYHPCHPDRVSDKRCAPFFKEGGNLPPTRSDEG